jgi:hypothetical protein
MSCKREPCVLDQNSCTSTSKFAKQLQSIYGLIIEVKTGKRHSEHLFLFPLISNSAADF